MGDRYISVNDAAVMWGVTYARARQIIVDGDVTSERFGGHLVVERASAEKLKRQRDAKRAKKAATKSSTHATA